MIVWRWFAREWCIPPLQTLWLTLILAITSILIVRTLDHAIDQGIINHARTSHAADRILRGSVPMPAIWREKAQALGLRISHKISFRTMLSTQRDTTTLDAKTTQLQLISVNAIDDAYPLLGKLTLSPDNQQLQQGSIAISKSLKNRISIKQGMLVEIGDAIFNIKGEIIDDPSVQLHPIYFAPPILMHIDDVKKTGALQPGSQIRYDDFFAGSYIALAEFESWLKPQLAADQKWIYPEQEQAGPLKNILHNTQQFLQLVTVVMFCLAIATLITVTRVYCQHRYERVALLKTLGAHHQIGRWLLREWLTTLLLAALSSRILIEFLYPLLQFLLQDILPLNTPISLWYPWLWTVVAVALITFFVGIRSYYQLMMTPPLGAFIQQLLPVWPLKYYLPVLLSLITLIAIPLLGNHPLSWLILASMIILILCTAALSWGVLCSLHLLVPHVPLSLRLALQRLYQQPLATVSQMCALATTLTLLFLLFLIRHDLLQGWRDQFADEQRPNYLLTHITPEQAPAVINFFHQHNITHSPFYPVVLARLIAINDKKPLPDAHHSINRELFVGASEALPLDNKIWRGKWPLVLNEASVEKKIAAALAINLGDVLTFYTNTQILKVRVSSIRDVVWDNFYPNFYFLLSPATISTVPQTGLMNFHYSGEEDSIISQFYHQFPQINLINGTQLIEEVLTTLNKFSRMLDIILFEMIFFALLLMLVQLQLSKNARQQELMLYRVIGASSKLLHHTMALEFALLGALTSIIAIISSYLIRYYITVYMEIFVRYPATNWIEPLLWPSITTLLLYLYGLLVARSLIKRVMTSRA